MSQCLYLEMLRQCWGRGRKFDYFFTSRCLYLEILRQCWGRGSKFYYTSSRLGSIFGDFTSVLGQRKQVRLFFFTSQCLYLEILRQCWGRGSKFDYTSSRLGVYIWRFYVSVGLGEASLTIFPHVLVSIFGDFRSMLGQGKQVRLFFFTS
jgi:hypothetical protein